MKKKSITLLIAITLAGCTLFSSCIGSFGLTNRLLAWNRTIDSKFVNELVFVAFWIVPVYEVSALADILVLNSIEFWSSRNPMTTPKYTTETIQTTKGTYAIETKADGYQIHKEGNAKVLDLVFDEADQSWSVSCEGQSVRLFRFTGTNKITMFLPDGQEMDVTLDQDGLLAFKAVAEKYTTYYATR